ncbi:N-acetylmuramoyl-L-alanine amidase [Halobacillus sp. A1]|uniref:SH3 domain-containing protein n=1 Tax=Halobacillus sp. A1 TaxID=2880262 RepID=UPI0020A69B89|nr:SH3 domain-containing protein [Halobacillus sp. A1]MCP3030419.1 N-acetylmuramoyl-L-alanine amidase [Halobacillus sp. A1]
MKGWMSLVFILACLLWLIPTAVHADSVKVQVDNLNVRSGPDLSHSALGKVQKNESYSIVDQKGDWIKINWNNKTGWVADWLVKVKQKETVKSKVDYLRVRSKAGMDGDIQGYLMKDEKVTKLDQQGEWVHIDRSKASGWVHQSYMSTYSEEQPKKTSEAEPSKSLGKVKVATALLNVRSKATSNSSILTQVAKGDSFEYFDEKQGWYKVGLSNNKSGWVAGWLVTKDNSSKTTPQSNTTVSLQYNATNLRSGPSTNHEVLGSSDKGDQLSVISKEGSWYKVSYKDSSAYVAGSIVKENKSSNIKSASASKGNLRGKTIVLDAGHGGFDPGAIGRNGTYEKTLTLQTAQNLKSTLEQNGASVVMTRTNDSYLSLSARTALSNASSGDVFISVHYNSVPATNRATGINTYFYNDSTQTLASNIQSGLINSTGLSDRGIANGNFHILRNNQKPSVLVELGFISDVNEEKTVNSSGFQSKASQGITNGLINYFK